MYRSVEQPKASFGHTPHTVLVFQSEKQTGYNFIQQATSILWSTQQRNNTKSTSEPQSEAHH